MSRDEVMADGYLVGNVAGYVDLHVDAEITATLEPAST
jgi:hypothetical protein